MTLSKKKNCNNARAAVLSMPFNVTGPLFGTTQIIKFENRGARTCHAKRWPSPTS